MPERISGDVELWDGWSLSLPNECMFARNADGSWSAWDAARTVDVNIITAAQTVDGIPIGPLSMLGREPNVSGNGWIGHVEEFVEPDDQGAAFRFAIAAAAENTLLSCWVAFRSEEDRRWADQILKTIVKSVTH